MRSRLHKSFSTVQPWDGGVSSIADLGENTGDPVQRHAKQAEANLGRGCSSLACLVLWVRCLMVSLYLACSAASLSTAGSLSTMLRDHRGQSSRLLLECQIIQIEKTFEH